MKITLTRDQLDNVMYRTEVLEALSDSVWGDEHNELRDQIRSQLPPGLFQTDEEEL